MISIRHFTKHQHNGTEPERNGNGQRRLELENFLGTAGVTGTIGALCGTVVGIATGPVGWCALGGALILGGT